VSLRRLACVVAGAIAAAFYLAPGALAETVLALSNGGNQLERFDSATPGTVFGTVSITGLQAGETLLTIDFRPANGQLDALSNQNRLYTVNPTTGAATQVGSSGAFTLSGTFFGMDVNPVVDRIRVVSDADQNLRLNPNDGTLTATDATLAYAAGDPNFGANPNEVALAYSNNVAGALSTTLYGIDSGLDVLVMQGGPGGIPSANGGVLTTVGALGVDTSGLAGFDISPGGTAYAMLHSLPLLPGDIYTINLATGAATLVGAIGGVAVVSDITVALGPTAVRMRSLEAVRSPRGVVIRWRTAAESRTLGFDVYREERGRRVRLNGTLIPSAFSGAGRTYSYLDRRPLRSRSRYWIEAVGIDGSRSSYGPASVRPR
jgi:Domain of unknown function (DUF4394)